MNFIFIHPNFPAQFRHMVEFLGKHKQNKVVFITENARPEWNIPGVRKIVFKEETIPDGLNSPPLMNFARINAKGEAVGKILLKLRQKNFIPDLICGHSGWGVTMYIKDIFPDTPFLGYFEWYYHPLNTHLSSNKKKRINVDTRIKSRNRSLSILNDLAACDHGLCPTAWQKKQFPREFHHKLSVIHDGIDPRFFSPDPERKLQLTDLDLTSVKEIVTYTTRGFEPYRGFPQFIESIPMILEKRPEAHIVIVGEDRICYGPKLAPGKTWKTLMTDKINLDPERVHFIDPLPYGKYLQVLQASTVHVYLTVPFVLSWSLLEAMACECMVVASDTPPVREVIQNGVNGVLVNLFDPGEIAEKVAACLEYPSFMQIVKKNARKTVVEKYRLDKMLARQLHVVKQLTQKAKSKSLFG